MVNLSYCHHCSDSGVWCYLEQITGIYLFKHDEQSYTWQTKEHFLQPWSLSVHLPWNVYFVGLPSDDITVWIFFQLNPERNILKNNTGKNHCTITLNCFQFTFANYIKFCLFCDYSCRTICCSRSIFLPIAFFIKYDMILNMSNGYISDKATFYVILGFDLSAWLLQRISKWLQTFTV